MKGGSIEPPNIVIVDEAHHARAASMKGGSIEPPNVARRKVTPAYAAGFNEGGLY